MKKMTHSTAFEVGLSFKILLNMFSCHFCSVVPVTANVFLLMYLLTLIQNPRSGARQARTCSHFSDIYLVSSPNGDEGIVYQGRTRVPRNNSVYTIYKYKFTGI